MQYFVSVPDITMTLCNHDSTWLVWGAFCISGSPRSPCCRFSGAAGGARGDQCAQSS